MEAYNEETAELADTNKAKRYRMAKLKLHEEEVGENFS